MLLLSQVQLSVLAAPTLSHSDIWTKITPSHLLFHEYVCRQEGNHNLLQPSGCKIKPCLVVILISCTNLPTLQKWNSGTHKICVKSQITLSTVFHLIFLVINLIYCSSQCDIRIILIRTIFMSSFNSFEVFEKNPEIHWLRDFFYLDS